MSIKIHPDDLGKELMGRAKKMPGVIKKGARRAAQRGRALMVRRTPVDRGQLKAAWRVTKGTGDTLAGLENDAPYAAIAMETGARPHAVSREGQEAIALWAKRKFQISEKESKRVAYAIARKIRKHGQPPRYIVRDSLDELLAIAREEISRAISKQAKRKARKGTRGPRGPLSAAHVRGWETRRRNAAAKRKK